jgi:uncharacterized protein
MPLHSRTRRLALLFGLYLMFCSVIGVLVADGSLDPPHRPLTEEAKSGMRQRANALDAEFHEVAITTADHISLSAWILQPRRGNGNAVILLHGVGDNRLGMTGYAELLLSNGYAVLLPDARAHGNSGGKLATYGLLESNDIHQWFDWQSLRVGTQFCAVVAESSFSNFREMAYVRMGQPFHLGPWLGRTFLRPIVEVAFLRARWTYRLNMDSISPENSVGASQIPILLIHGQIDSNIPVQHSQRIHALNPNTVLWEVPNADHCGAHSAAPQEFEKRLLNWFASHSQNMKTNKLATGS